MGKERKKERGESEGEKRECARVGKENKEIYSNLIFNGYMYCIRRPVFKQVSRLVNWEEIKYRIYHYKACLHIFFLIYYPLFKSAVVFLALADPNLNISVQYYSDIIKDIFSLFTSLTSYV